MSTRPVLRREAYRDRSRPRRRRRRRKASRLVELDLRPETMTAPVLLVGLEGEVLGANEEGHRLLRSSDFAPRTSLATLEGGNATAKIWALTPLRNARGLVGFVASCRSQVSSAPEASASDAVGEAARAWRLTDRKRQVLELVARGLTNSMVAATLAIAERTVEFHLSGIFERAGVESRASLLARLFAR